MKQEDVKAIFFDEYSVDARKLNFYYWDKRVEPVFLKKSENQFYMSFEIRKSRIKIYGLIGVLESIDSNIIIQYLSESCVKETRTRI